MDMQQIDSLLHRLANSFPNLRFLSLLGNPGYPDQLTHEDGDDSHYKRYRQQAIHLLPGLCFLDSRRITATEKLEAFKRAQFIDFVIRPTEEQLARHDSADEAPFPGLSDVSPPSGSRTSAAFGKLKYRYTGKHSEGNRFIRNNEL